MKHLYFFGHGLTTPCIYKLLYNYTKETFAMTDIVDDYADVGRLLTYPGPNVRFPVCTFTTALVGGLVPPQLKVILCAPNDPTKTEITDITVIVDAVHSPADLIYNAGKNVFRVWLKVSPRLFDSQRTFDFVLYALNGDGGGYQSLGDAFMLSTELKFIGDVTDHVDATVSADTDGVYSLKFYPDEDVPDSDGYIPVGSMCVFGGMPNSEELLPYTVTVMEDDAAETIVEGVNIKQELLENYITRLTMYYKPTGTQSSRNGSMFSHVYVTVRDKALRTICKQFKLLPLSNPIFGFEELENAYKAVSGYSGFVYPGDDGALPFGHLTVDGQLISSGFTFINNSIVNYYFLNSMVYIKGVQAQLPVQFTKIDALFTENGRDFYYTKTLQYYVFDAIGASSNNVSLANYQIDAIVYPNVDEMSYSDYFLLANITVDNSVRNISVQAYSANKEKLASGSNEFIVTVDGPVVQILISKTAMDITRSLYGGNMYYVGIYDNNFVQAPSTAPANAADIILPAKTLFYAFNVVLLENPVLAFQYNYSDYTNDVYPGFYSDGFNGTLGTFTVTDSVDSSAAFSLDGTSSIYTISNGVFALTGDGLVSTNNMQQTVPGSTVYFMENGREFVYEIPLHYYIFDAIGALSKDVNLDNYQIKLIYYPDFDAVEEGNYIALANITVQDSVSAAYLSAQVYGADRQQLLSSEVKVVKTGSVMQILVSKILGQPARALTGETMYYVGIYDNMFVEAPLVAPASAEDTTQSARIFFHAFNVVAVANPALTFTYIDSPYTDGVYPGIFSVNFGGSLGTFTIAEPVDITSVFALSNPSNMYHIFDGTLSLTNDARLSKGDEQQTVAEDTVQIVECGRTFLYKQALHYYIFDSLVVLDASDLNNTDNILNPYDKVLTAVTVYPDHDIAIDNYIPFLSITMNDTVDASHLAVQFYDLNGAKTESLNVQYFVQDGLKLQIALLASVPRYRGWNNDHTKNMFIYDSLLVTPPQTWNDCHPGPRSVMHLCDVSVFENPEINFAAVELPDSRSVEGDNPGYLWDGINAGINLYALTVKTTISDVSNAFSFVDASKASFFIIGANDYLTIQHFDTAGVITLPANILQVSENGRQFAYDTPIQVYAYQALEVGLVTNMANSTSTLSAAEDGSYALYYYPAVDKIGDMLVLGSVGTTDNASNLAALINAPFAANVMGSAFAEFTTTYNPNDFYSVGDRDGSTIADEVVLYLYDSRFVFTKGIYNGRAISVTFKLYPIAVPQVQFTWREADGQDNNGVRGYIAEDDSSDICLGTVAVMPLSGSLPEAEVVVTMVATDKYMITGDVGVGATSPAKVYARSKQYAPNSDSSTTLLGSSIVAVFAVTENGRTIYSDGRSSENDDFYLFQQLQVYAEHKDGVVHAEENDFYSLSNPVTLLYGLGKYTVDVTVVPVPIEPVDTYSHKKQVFQNITFTKANSEYFGGNTPVSINASQFALENPLGEPVDTVTQFASFLHTNTITSNFNGVNNIVSETVQVWNNFEQTLLENGHEINIYAGANQHIPYSFFAVGGIMADGITGIVTFNNTSLPLVYNSETLALDYWSGSEQSPITYNNITFTIGLGEKQAIISGVTVHFYLDIALTLPLKTLQFVKCIDNSNTFKNSIDKVYNYENAYTVGKNLELGLSDAPSIYYGTGHPRDAINTSPTVSLTKLIEGEYVATADATVEWRAGIDYSTHQLIITDVSLDPHSTYKVQVSSSPSSIYDPSGKWVVKNDVPLNTVTSLSSDANAFFLFELVDPKFEIKPIAVPFDPSKAMVNFAPNAFTIDYSPKNSVSNNVDLNGGKDGRAPLLYNAFQVLVHNPDGIFALSQFKHNVRIGFVHVDNLDGVTYDNVKEKATTNLVFVSNDAQTYTGCIEVQVTPEHAYILNGEDKPLASIVGIVTLQSSIAYGKYKLVILSMSDSDLTKTANGVIYDGFVFDTILWTTANVSTAKLEQQEDLSLQWPDHLLLQFNSLELYSFNVDGTQTSVAADAWGDPSPVYTFNLQARNGSSDFATICSQSGCTYDIVQSKIAALVLPERMIAPDVNGSMQSWMSTSLWLEYRVLIENDALGQDLKDIAHYVVSNNRHEIYTKGQFTDFRVPGSLVTVRETLRDDKSLLQTICVKSEAFSSGINTYIFNVIETVSVTAEVEAGMLALKDVVASDAVSIIVLSKANVAVSALAVNVEYDAALAALATVQYVAPAAMLAFVDSTKNAVNNARYYVQSAALILMQMGNDANTQVTIQMFDIAVTNFRNGIDAESELIKIGTYIRFVVSSPDYSRNLGRGVSEYFACVIAEMEVTTAFREVKKRVISALECVNNVELMKDAVATLPTTDDWWKTTTSAVSAVLMAASQLGLAKTSYASLLLLVAAIKGIVNATTENAAVAAAAIAAVEAAAVKTAAVQAAAVAAAAENARFAAIEENIAALQSTAVTPV